MEHQKRWYDIDPTVSLAVNLIKNSTEDVQLKCADYIITQSKAFGVQYLRSAPLDFQRELALEIVNFLQYSG